MTDDYITLQFGKNIKSSKIAAFDFDDTLIISDAILKTKFKKWDLLDKGIISFFKKLYIRNFNIVIFTNQFGNAKSEKDLTKWIEKMGDFICNLIEKIDPDVSIKIYASLKKNYHRKPHINMFSQYCISNNIKDIDYEHSFYCGDAAGRICPSYYADIIKKKTGRIIKKDFSDSDRKFAHNIGLNFYVPEELFTTNNKESIFSNKYNFSFKGFDYRTYNHPESTIDMTAFTGVKMNILIGAPASGKSTFSKKLLKMTHKSKWINRDTHGKKCLRITEEALKEKKMVVIDNTNPDDRAREPYEHLAEKYGYEIRYIYFDVSKDLAKHLNNVRHVVSNGEKELIPDIAYNIFYKNVKIPKNTIKIPFILDDSTDVSFLTHFDKLY